VHHDDIRKRLCALVSRVGVTRYASVVPHDCFCGDKLVIPNPIVDEQIVTYIENAVDAQLHRDAGDDMHMSVSDEINMYKRFYEQAEDARYFLSVQLQDTKRQMFLVQQDLHALHDQIAADAL